MLYVGHFTFLGPKPEIRADPTPSGWFALVAEAESVGAAAEKFREHVEQAKGLFSFFEPVETVWLEDIVEIKRLPEEGVLTHFHLQPDDRGASVATALPGVSEEFCVAYDRPANREPLEDDPDSWHEDPFVDFGE